MQDISMSLCQSQQQVYDLLKLVRCTFYSMILLPMLQTREDGGRYSRTVIAVEYVTFETHLLDFLSGPVYAHLCHVLVTGPILECRV
jgi:hypothetical protein